MSFISKLWGQETFANRLQLSSGIKTPFASRTDFQNNDQSSSSVIAGGRTLSRTKETTAETSILSLKRYQRNIQHRFQILLDAQAERLLATIGGSGVENQSLFDDVASSSGASTRTSEHGKVIPVRQPVRQRLTLRGARKEIGAALSELAIVKDQEKQIYDAELKDKAAIVARIQAWESQQADLNKEIEQVQASDPNSRRQGLQNESAILEEQITALENQLMELKSHHNAVKLELSRVENSMQSRLSSYNESLRLLEHEVKNFLSEPLPSLPGLLDEETSYTILPPSRRTLKMALEHTNEEIIALRDCQKNSQEESEATKEGQIVWMDVVSAVTKLEQHLRRSTNITKLDTDRYTEDSMTMPQLQQAIEEVAVDLDSKLKLAEARGWKLLVCCIGAELEALKQGLALLNGTTSKDATDVPYDTNRAGKSSANLKGKDPNLSMSPERHQPVQNTLNENTITGENHTDRGQRSSEEIPWQENEEFLRRESDQESKIWNSRLEKLDLARSSPMLRSESAEGGSTRRSLDSFRRRSERAALRPYRPQDDEPAPDLLVTQPDINDIE